MKNGGNALNAFSFVFLCLLAEWLLMDHTTTGGKHLREGKPWKKDAVFASFVILPLGGRGGLFLSKSCFLFYRSHRSSGYRVSRCLSCFTDVSLLPYVLSSLIRIDQFPKGMMGKSA